MKNMKRFLPQIAFLLVICTVSLILHQNFINFIPTSGRAHSRRQVIIDPGHGGFDGGAVAHDGTVEKDINLKIALCLADLLKSTGYDVILTRDSDVSTDDSSAERIGSRKKSDLKNRLELMKNYPDAVFVSIHLNKFTTSAASGSQVFYSAKFPESKVLGDNVQSYIVKLLQPHNRRVNKQATSSTYLLYNATIPAILVECGFLSNRAELELLKNEDYQRKLAFCCFCGINDYFGNKGVKNNAG